MKLRDRAFEISQACDYLAAACDVDKVIELERKTKLGYFKFDALNAGPHVVLARLESFEKWKANCVQAYRKGAWPPLLPVLPHLRDRLKSNFKIWSD